MDNRLLLDAATLECVNKFSHRPDYPQMRPMEAFSTMLDVMGSVLQFASNGETPLTYKCDAAGDWYFPADRLWEVAPKMQGYLTEMPEDLVINTSTSIKLHGLEMDSVLHARMDQLHTGLILQGVGTPKQSFSEVAHLSVRYVADLAAELDRHHFSLTQDQRYFGVSFPMRFTEGKCKFSEARLIPGLNF